MLNLFLWIMLDVTSRANPYHKTILIMFAYEQEQ